MVPPAATYSWLRIEKHRVRKMVKRQMIAGLPEEELVLLAFTAHDAAAHLRWEHSREFEYQGQMYDVMHTVRKGDTIYYRCWPDHAETSLNRRLALLVEQALHHHPQNHDARAKYVQFFKSLFYAEHPLMPVWLVACSPLPEPGYFVKWSNHFLQTVDPPPERFG
jgi:hypothetical protein